MENNTKKLFYGDMQILMSIATVLFIYLVEDGILALLCILLQIVLFLLSRMKRQPQFIFTQYEKHRITKKMLIAFVIIIQIMHFSMAIDNHLDASSYRKIMFFKINNIENNIKNNKR